MLSTHLKLTRAVINTPIFNYIPEKYHRDIKNNLRLRDKNEWGKKLFEFEFIKKNNLCTPVEIHSNPIIENNRVKSILIVARDITERKRREQQLKEYREHLEELVENKTSSLKRKTKLLKKSQVSLEKLLQEKEQVNKELQKINARYKLINQELNAFAYSVSHDLRAPLRRIILLWESVFTKIKKRLNDNEYHQLQLIQNEAIHMSEMVKSLLKLSRIVRRDMQLTKINLSSMTEEISQNMEKMLKKRQIEFKIQKDLTVKGDQHLLKSVMNNLINNACKYSKKKGKVIIEFGAKMIGKERVFYVKDNGIGFDEKFAKEIFNPFRRLHKPEDYGGIGIGLTNVYRIIKRHKGKIWAESDKGKGSIFYFTIGEHPNHN